VSLRVAVGGGSWLAPLADAMSGRAPSEDIPSLVTKAIDAGELVPCGVEGDHLVAMPGLPGSMLDPAGDWAALGYRPLRLKRVHVPAEAAGLLRAVFEALRERTQPRCVPHWMAHGFVASLHLDDARDLRDIMTDAASADVAGLVLDACVNSLEHFVDADGDLRAAARSARTRPAPFPVTTRYQGARELCGQLLGSAAVLDLPTEIDDATGPRVLFNDPKPANLVLRASDAGDWLGAPRTVAAPARIDLDLLHFETSIALQLVIALFAHPLDGLDVTQRHAIAAAAAERWDVAPDDIDRVLTYHLLRNFTTAAAAGQTAKARAFAHGLRELAPVLLGPAATALPDALASWARQAGTRLR
jgi:hypothetical protein